MSTWMCPKCSQEYPAVSEQADAIKKNGRCLSCSTADPYEFSLPLPVCRIREECRGPRWDCSEATCNSFKRCLEEAKR